MLDLTLRVSYKVVQAALMPRLQRVVGGRAAQRGSVSVAVAWSLDTCT